MAAPRMGTDSMLNTLPLKGAALLLGAHLARPGLWENSTSQGDLSLDKKGEGWGERNSISTQKEGKGGNLFRKAGLGNLSSNCICTASSFHLDCAVYLEGWGIDWWGLGRQCREFSI